MAELVKAGKVRCLGLVRGGARDARSAVAVHPIAAVQSEYSLWSRDPEDGVLAACRRARRRLRRLQPARPRLPHRADQALRGPRRRRLPPPVPALPGRELPEEPRPRRTARRSIARRSTAPPRSSRSRGCSRRATTIGTIEAPHVPRRERRRERRHPRRRRPRAHRRGRPASVPPGLALPRRLMSAIRCGGITAAGGPGRRPAGPLSRPTRAAHGWLRALCKPERVCARRGARWTTYPPPRCRRARGTLRADASLLWLTPEAARERSRWDDAGRWLRGVNVGVQQRRSEPAAAVHLHDVPGGSPAPVRPRPGRSRRKPPCRAGRVGGSSTSPSHARLPPRWGCRRCTARAPSWHPYRPRPSGALRFSSRHRGASNRWGTPRRSPTSPSNRGGGAARSSALSPCATRLPDGGWRAVSSHPLGFSTLDTHRA